MGLQLGFCEGLEGYITGGELEGYQVLSESSLVYSDADPCPDLADTVLEMCSRSLQAKMRFNKR